VSHHLHDGCQSMDFTRAELVCDDLSVNPDAACGEYLYEDQLVYESGRQPRYCLGDRFGRVTVTFTMQSRLSDARLKAVVQ